MDLQQRTQRFGAAVILCVLCLRLWEAGMPEKVTAWLTQPETAAFLIYLETGQDVRFSASSDVFPPFFRESPPPWIEPEEIPVFTPEDEQLVKIYNTSGKKYDLSRLLAQPLTWNLRQESPTVLILHTHATESYQNWNELYYDPAYTCRETDTSRNMVSVGEILTEKLNSLGYNTLHDATLHDYPNYNGSYDRSKATVESYLEKYPSIKVVLDIHRDAIERADGTRIKPVVTINGKPYAQVMIISGADNGYLNMPNYKKNLRFASHLQNSMETLYPGFTRPILFDYRNYNQQLTTGSLLIEVGGHANTLEEAQNSAVLIACSLADVFDSMQ